MEPTPVLCLNGATLMQLWACKRSGERQWRQLPTFGEALRTYGGKVMMP
jgi:hypothetical protein